MAVMMSQAIDERRLSGSRRASHAYQVRLTGVWKQLSQGFPAGGIIIFDLREQPR
jgi:hypothetical protein